MKVGNFVQIVLNIQSTLTGRQGAWVEVNNFGEARMVHRDEEAESTEKMAVVVPPSQLAGLHAGPHELHVEDLKEPKRDE